jgi:hypothetical protein
MDALFLFGQALALSALVYGGYLARANWHLSDRQGLEREFRADSGLQPPAERYDPYEDPKVAGDIGVLL